MKIAILCRKDVSGWYAATLMERGHEVTISGCGALHAAALKPYLDCDGCLLLSDEPDLLEIADYMETSGKKIWRELSGIPAATPTDIKRAEAKRAEKRRAEKNEKKRVNCLSMPWGSEGSYWGIPPIFILFVWRTNPVGSLCADPIRTLRLLETKTWSGSAYTSS